VEIPYPRRPELETKRGEMGGREGARTSRKTSLEPQVFVQQPPRRRRIRASYQLALPQNKFETEMVQFSASEKGEGATAITQITQKTVDGGYSKRREPF